MNEKHNNINLGKDNNININIDENNNKIVNEDNNLDFQNKIARQNDTKYIRSKSSMRGYLYKIERLISRKKLLGFVILKEKWLNLEKYLKDILNYIKRINSFQNAYIAYRIVLTITVSVASAERSFSKLKLIKSYLRSTMS